MTPGTGRAPESESGTGRLEAGSASLVATAIGRNAKGRISLASYAAAAAAGLAFVTP